MKTAPTLPLANPPLLAESQASEAVAIIKQKVSAYITLTKPRIAAMVLFTVATGFLLGGRGSSHPSTLILTLLGTSLVAGGASVWNQVIERDRDALMRRTRTRPLPAGRVTPTEAGLFGALLTLIGVAILATFTNHVAAAVAFATFALYVLIYTPIKPLTTLNTAVGAIPGALPPVIGWSAATGRLGIEAWALFLIVFLWQFPHFLAIAWIHREDYARGGHKMLPLVDPHGLMTGRQSVAHALALIPVGVLPVVINLAGPVYFAGALILGLLYFHSALRFWLDVSDSSARRLLRMSILYLPSVLILLLLNPMPS
jgi:protoheme IX farnesyltransferase